MVKNIIFFLFVLVVAISMLIGENLSDKVVFLDVGQGDLILPQDGYRQVLIDGGPGMKVLEPLAKEMPWMDRKIEVVRKLYTRSFGCEDCIVH